MSNIIGGEVPEHGTLKGQANILLGKDGESAYDIACRNGFEGTEEEWLETLTKDTEKAVDEWIKAHPEAVTTVQDHSLTINKMVIGTLGYVTPCMFGATVDGSGAANSEALSLALTYALENNVKVVIDKPYTFQTIDFSNVNHVTLEGIGKINVSVTGLNGVGINIPTTHNVIKNLAVRTSADITMLSVTGKYNVFENFHAWGGNSDVGVGCDVTTWCNTFTDCSIREFNECVKVNGNFITFINCVIVGSNKANGANITINGGYNIVFNTCDIEKGKGLMTVNDGVVSVAKSYCEGGSSPHFRLNGGVVMFDSNYLHNTIMHKYENCAFTIVNNLLESSLAESYFLICKSANIGYLVAENNRFIDDNGIFTRVNKAKEGGSSIPRIYYQDTNGTWQTGTMGGYYRLNQEKCWSVEDKGVVSVRLTNHDKLYSGATANRDYYGEWQPIGATWFDTTIGELFVRGDGVWHRAGSVWATDATLPSNPTAGQVHFYNGKPVWYNGTAWVDATGTTI